MPIRISRLRHALDLLSRHAVLITSFNVLLTISGLYAALYALHQSRDIALEGEEHKLTIELGLRADSTVFGDSLPQELQDYENVRWDLEIHRRTHDGMVLSLLMHWRPAKDDRDDPEAILLAKLYYFYLKRAQERLKTLLPEKLAALANGSNPSLAEAQLAKLITTGYYLQLFDNWDKGKQMYLKMIANQQTRGRLALMLDQIDYQLPNTLRARVTLMTFVVLMLVALAMAILTRARTVLNRPPSQAETAALASTAAQGL